jgi:hypothetical protein
LLVGFIFHWIYDDRKFRKAADQGEVGIEKAKYWLRKVLLILKSCKNYLQKIRYGKEKYLLIIDFISIFYIRRS